MRYIIGTVLALCLLSFIACSNSDGGSPMIRRTMIDYKDLNVYGGSKKAGALQKKIVATESQNADSLFRHRTIFNHLPMFKSQIEDKENIRFEFLEDGMLAYYNVRTTTSSGNKMISKYVFEGDDLYILKDGTEKVYVATKEKDSNKYYRLKAVMKRLYDGKVMTEEDTISYYRTTIDMDVALDFAGFENKREMTNPKDSVVWCNVKYIYE